MKGKFRKRSSAVWCPKPKEKVNWNEVTKEQEKEFLSIPLGEKERYNKFIESLPKKHLSRTGWINISHCVGCEYLEEFHIDNDGVFCLYGIE